MNFLTIIFVLFVQFGCADDHYYYNNHEKITLTPQVSLSRSNSNIDYYDTQNGITVGVSDNIIVKINPDANVTIYLDEFNLTIEKELDENLYLLKAQNKNLTIDIANRLSEKSDIHYAHPDFMKKTVSR